MTDNAPAQRNYLTIVSGLPRSGTSMMMRMLEAGGMPVLTDYVRQADADNPRGYYEFEAVKRLKEDTSWLDGAQGKAVKMVYRLLYDLPEQYEYRVIFMCRKLEEVLASQRVMLERKGTPGSAGDDARLAEIYQRELDEAAHWLASRPNFSVLYVEYRTALDEPPRTAQQVNDFLDGTLDLDGMVKVPEPSLYRRRAQNGRASGARATSRA